MRNGGRDAADDGDDDEDEHEHDAHSPEEHPQ